MTPGIGVGQWIGLNFETRQELIKMFGLVRSAGTVVENGVLKTDGYTDKDLEAISVEALQKALQSPDTNFFALFDTLLAQLEDARLNKATETQEDAEKKRKEAKKKSIKQSAELLAKAAKMMEDEA